LGGNRRFSIKNSLAIGREAGKVRPFAMKRNLIGVLLAGIFCLSVLATAFLSFTYVRSARELQKLQHQAGLVNANRTRINALAAEAVEYSKRNPAIDPILHSLRIKPRPGSNAARPSSNPPAFTP
jgi:hypothetical protein